MSARAAARGFDLVTRVPSFRLLFFATLGSGFGTWLAFVALAIDLKDPTDSGPSLTPLLIAHAPTIQAVLAPRARTFPFTYGTRDRAIRSMSSGFRYPRERGLPSRVANGEDVRRGLEGNFDGGTFDGGIRLNGCQRRSAST